MGTTFPSNPKPYSHRALQGRALVQSGSPDLQEMSHSDSEAKNDLGDPL